MALFGSKDKKTTEEKAVAPATKPSAVSIKNLAGVLLRPRITEKATDHIAEGVYVFDIHPNANKTMVKEAIKKTYNVTPRAIRVVIKKSRRVRNPRTGKYGSTTGEKKAYVYLKKGDSISVM